MNARIKVSRSRLGFGFFWRCKCPGVVKCTPSVLGMCGHEPTLAGAADAGRAHLAEHHAQGYCRLHGVHRSVCGCRVASVDPDALGGRENGSCDFISYTLHDNPLQTAHDTSREDC